MKLTVMPLTEEQIRTFVAWQYSGAYAMYNMSTEDMETQVRFFSDPENGYYAITDGQGELLGFCNFGADARVPGGQYMAEAIDIGMGMRPDLTGKGRGAQYAQAVFDFASSHYRERQQRVTIAEFNLRAQRLCRNFGFSQQSRFIRESDGKPFIIMVRDPQNDKSHDLRR
jgi:RimJ/RimL family protein N-acetyltransferase